MSNITDKFKTTDPEKLLGKIDSVRLKGIDLQDNANILILDTVGRYVKDPDAVMTTILKVENKIGEAIDKYLPDSISKAIGEGRSMLNSGLSALKESGIIGPDGKLNLDALITAGGKLLSDIGKPFISAIKDGIKKLRDLGDALGITSIIKTAKGWFKDVVGFIDSLVPDFIKDMFKALNWDNILPNMGSGVFDQVKDQFYDVATILDDEWWWFNKERKLYNYDTLAGLHPTTIKLLGITKTYDGTDLCNICTAVRKHYYTVERPYRTMRQYGDYR